MKLCRTYLYGMPFTVISDHSLLTWFLRILEPSGRLAKWVLYLQMFFPEIQHRRNPLSRPVLMVSTRQTNARQRNNEIMN